MPLFLPKHLFIILIYNKFNIKKKNNNLKKNRFENENLYLYIYI